MGIKNIHLVLISVAAIISLIFGVWGMKHDFIFLSVLAFVFSVGMIVYGVSFLKKVKAL